MGDLRYTKEHEWLAVDDGIGTVGITDYAQDQLGDVVYVELPEIDAEIARGGQAAVVESVKAASEVYAPVGGVVVETNAALADNPALINEAAMTTGWFFKLRISEPNEIDSLMDQAAYAQFVESLD
ncbi:MAG: glycine cleavage system protein GcvH [Proteobacteria bacterium]|nr:glycine cleavage system protein GcvH [Pseudomonadota bacterium]